MIPCSAPYRAHAASATRTAAHHGSPSATIHSATTAPQAAVKPAARSMSPSSSTKISAMPSVMMNADCSSRLTRFCAERNSEFLIWKKITTATRPMMTGSAPLSPERIRRKTIRTYSPIELASRSADASGEVIRLLAGGGGSWLAGSWLTDVKAQPSVLCAGALLAAGPVPVVIQWTAVSVLKSDSGPLVTSRPR